MNRPGIPLRARMRLPRFRAKNFSTCTRSPTARGSSHASHSPWDDVAFSSTERDRHLGIRPVSQLNTWPVVSPVNASRRPSRDAAHHSGSGRLARPSPWGTFTSYSLPASWRTPFRAKAQSRFAPARCAGASAERPVVGRERTAIAWWQGQHDQQARTVGVQRVIRIARRPAGHHADAPSDNDRSGAAMAKLP